jgi:hypothetical protein
LATSPDPTVVFMGDNPFGIPVGTPVGDSFDRTVSSTPEPNSLLVLGLGLASMGPFGWWKKQKSKGTAA